MKLISTDNTTIIQNDVAIFFFNFSLLPAPISIAKIIPNPQETPFSNSIISSDNGAEALTDARDASPKTLK